jgi:alkylation response protein AidB-like acyl-CoA dehydrogenase
MGRIHRQRSFISILRHASCRADDPFKREAGAALGVDGDFALRIPAQYGGGIDLCQEAGFCQDRL